MPIFEYRCKACGEVSEFLEKADEPARHTCPACGGGQMERKQFAAFSARVAPSARPAAKCAACESRGSCPLA
jgi:putative FmdB family regulatory protein